MKTWLLDFFFRENLFKAVHPTIKILAILCVPVVISYSLLPNLLAANLFLIILIGLQPSGMKLLLISIPSLLIVAVVVLVKIYIDNHNTQTSIEYGIKLGSVLMVTMSLFIATGFLEVVQGLDILLAPMRFFKINPRAITIGILIAGRLFVLCIADIYIVKKAFKARGSKLSGIQGVSNLTIALFYKYIRSVDEIAETLFIRGVELSQSNSLTIRHYSWWRTISFILGYFFIAFVLSFDFRLYI
jgi:energy-coupling factor transporter transmembrane protein EcfT